MTIISHIVGSDGLKDCFREPIPEIFEAARLLDSAVSAHLLGNSVAADKALRAADMPVIGEWIDSIWLGPWGPPYRPITKVSGLPPVLPKADRFFPRDAAPAMKRALVVRDGHHCRLCGIPLVRSEIRKKLTQLYPDAARWTGVRAAQQHRGLQVMWLQYDHVIVHSRGGKTTMENLVVTCPACNYGRDRFMLQEVKLRDPRFHVRRPVWEGWRTWQGLERILPPREQFLSKDSDCGDSCDSLRSDVPSIQHSTVKRGTGRGPNSTTTSENEFFDHLAIKRPEVLGTFKAFLWDVGAIGLSPEFGKTARLLLTSISEITATAGIIESNGTFWASGAWAAANRNGRPDAGENYLEAIANITGGSVRRYEKAAPEVLDPAGRGTDALLLLERATDWKQAIATLVRELSDV